jgi:hypothetical protein
MLCIFCIFCIFDIFCIFLFCVCVRLKKNMGQSMGLEGRALACEPALGNSLAFCWDHIKASTHTKQLDIFFCILFAYSAYCAYCNMQNMQNLNMALFFGILFGIFCISFCIL